MSNTKILNIRLVTPDDLTDEQGETAYYAALGALVEAIPDLSDDRREAITSESGFAFEESDVDIPQDWPKGPLTPTMGGTSQLVLVGTEEDGELAYYRCTVHSTDDKDNILIGYDTYCEDA